MGHSKLVQQAALGQDNHETIKRPLARQQAALGQETEAPRTCLYSRTKKHPLLANSSKGGSAYSLVRYQHVDLIGEYQEEEEVDPFGHVSRWVDGSFSSFSSQR